jgi:hypothetical protein
MQIKLILGITSLILTLLSYVPYVKDILKNKTRPHLYTWVVWAVVTFIAFGLQVSHSAGPGAFMTFAAGLACFLVIALGVIKKVEIKITKIDSLFLVLSIISVVLWLWVEKPVLSTILVALTSFLAFVPTIIKSWQDPFSETVSFYVINTVRYFLSYLALDQFNFVSSFYLITWVAVNAFFTVMLHFRRQALAELKRS